VHGRRTSSGLIRVIPIIVTFSRFTVRPYYNPLPLGDASAATCPIPWRNLPCNGSREPGPKCVQRRSRLQTLPSNTRGNLRQNRLADPCLRPDGQSLSSGRTKNLYRYELNGCSLFNRFWDDGTISKSGNRSVLTGLGTILGRFQNQNPS